MRQRWREFVCWLRGHDWERGGWDVLVPMLYARCARCQCRRYIYGGR